MKTTALRAATCGLLLSAASVSLANPFAFVMDVNAATRIAALEAKRLELFNASESIVNGGEADGDLTEDQLDTITANTTEIEKLDKQIAALSALLPKGQGRKTAPEARTEANGGGRQTVHATARDNQRHNFINMGEFAMAVRAKTNGEVENDGVKKLLNAVTTYGNEGAGADGGFLVPPEFSREIWKKVEAEENLMNRCVPLTPGGNSMTIPKDETTPWGTAGLQVYWDGEAQTIADSKATFEQSTIRLNKLTALAAATDELLEDAPGYESWIMAKVPGIMTHKINTAILDGGGVGMPLGALKSASLISVAKETSQPADTVWFANIQKMWGRMYAPWRRNAVWIVNQDVEAQLEAMAFQPAGASSQLPTAASTPVYLPPGGIADAPYGRLKGRPVIPLQAAKTIGDQGDIMLIDFNQYWILRKAAGPKVDTSIHLLFDQSKTAFRFVWRMAGQPAWSAAITPQNGANTLSWAVALDAR
ncbi:MAG: phage major capsid protein [Pseudolabrys sp.]